jgi:[ribosomal protein S5]-alanine N-acetyltransferase
MLPDTFHTARLKLRPIVPEDAGPIFDGYAQDTTVTRFVIWRPHRSRSDTEAYIAQCLASPPNVSRTYVLTDRIDGDVRGAFALRQAAPHRLDCGYVLADPDYATGGTISVCSICGSIFSIACGEICRASKPGASGSAMLSCSINST